LAHAYYVTDRPDRAVEVLERALTAVAEVDAELALTAEATIAMAGLVDGRTAPAALRRAEALHGRLGMLADPPVSVLVMSAYFAARVSLPAEAWELAQRALACEPYPPPLEICNALIVTLALIERYDAVKRLCEDLLVAARRCGAIQELIGVLIFRAAASCDCGALAEAEADARWALERAQGIFRIHAASEVIRVLIERDELQGAEDVLQQCDDPLASRSIRVLRFLIARGGLHGAQGRLQEALADFLECGKRCERLDV